MDNIKYTITLDDCRDYVKFQQKIPRMKKYKFKQFLPLIIIFILLVLFSIAMEVNFFFKAFDYVGGQYSMSFAELMKSDFSSLLLEGITDHFWTMNLPVFVIWAVIFFIAWFISKNDIFHAESGKIYNGLKKQTLDIEVSLQNDGLLCSGKDMSFVYKWNDIIDFYDTQKLFLVYVAETSALIIPKRAFKSSAEAQEFFNTVKGRLNKK